MSFSLIAIAILAHLAPRLPAQMSISPDLCIGDIAALPNCDKANSQFTKCGSLTDQQELVACVCTQDLFSAYLL